MRNPLRKDKQNGTQDGRPNLQALAPIADTRARSPGEFAPNGKGGHEENICAHGVFLQDFCVECEAMERVKKVVNMDALADKIETNPLDKIADIVHGLTYQQMVQFCHEYRVGQRIDNFAVDEADCDTQTMAAQMHKWCILRAKA